MPAISIVILDTCAGPSTAEAKLVLLMPPQMVQVSRNPDTVSVSITHGSKVYSTLNMWVYLKHLSPGF